LNCGSLSTASLPTWAGRPLSRFVFRFRFSLHPLKQNAMDSLNIKRKRLLPFLQSKKHSILFLLINIYLLIGVVSLLVTIAYLLGHLNQADAIVRYCIPGFVLGISSGIIYYAGYQSMVAEEKDKKWLH